MRQRGSALVWVVLAILVILGVAYWASRRAPGPTPTAEKAPIPGDTLNIGVILPLTGSAASYGTPEIRGIEIAAGEINAAGGVLGKPIKTIVEDGKCDKTEGGKAANKLINVDGVKFIIGGACSGETFGFTDMAEQNKVIVISPSATNPDLSDAGEYIFRTAPSDAIQAKLAAEYAYNTVGSRNVGIIHETTDYATGLARVFSSRFSGLGGKVVAVEKFNTGETDFSAQTLKVKAGNPDLVYLTPQAPAEGGLLLRQLRDNGVTAPGLGAEVFASQSMIDENKQLFEGFLFTEPYYDQAAPKAKSYLDTYLARYGEPPEFPFYSAGAYSDVYLIAEAVGAVGYDTTKVKGYLLGLKDWEGALGTISFDAKGDVVTAYAIRKVENGTFTTLEVAQSQ